MTSSTGFLRSRFGHRLLLSFMLCALLPVGGIAIVLQLNLSRQLEDQARRRLHDGAKSLGYTILQRLQTLEYGLGSAASQVTAVGDLPQRLGPFSSITTAPASTLTADQSKHLAGGNGWLTLRRDTATTPRLFLTARIARNDESGGLLVAELQPDSLWQALDPGAIESDAELTVLDEDGAVLYLSLIHI